jgi:hypothetical protein
MLSDVTFLLQLRLKCVVPSGTNATSKFREKSKELNNED